MDSNAHSNRADVTYSNICNRLDTRSYALQTQNKTAYGVRNFNGYSKRLLILKALAFVPYGQRYYRLIIFLLMCKSTLWK